ncbi:hypothetical protein E8E11_009139 [Didymella keratinophila]|nr:hypothetical protein E8E11_009139 [Didymella keratinophila]
MPHDIDDNEYVAKLLVQDAKKTTKTYDLVGLDAFNPKRSRAGAPKPNTSFLRHIIRQTDSHNAALLAKEAEESSSRLRQMNRGMDRQRTEAVDIAKRRIEGREWTTRKKRKTIYEETAVDETAMIGQTRGPDGTETEAGTGTGIKGAMKAATKSELHASREDREITERTEIEDVMTVTWATRDLLMDVEAGASLAPELCLAQAEKSRRRPHSPASDSDPLEAIVGPLPPPPEPTVRSRGRGALKSNSLGIESRFSTNYDPSIDLEPGSDVEDACDEALEAMRDRERWKQQGADRLRAAGFRDEQVKKWEKGGDPMEEDVVWTKKGQRREWDRGKVVDDDGDVALEAEWGRLK